MSRRKINFLLTIFLSMNLISLSVIHAPMFAQSRQRARDMGIEVGILKTGPWNGITDVEGVRVGHVTLIIGDSVRTGVTAIIPHKGNLFQDKVPGAVYVGNGFGKITGSTQVEELGEIETPVILTNTLSVSVVVGAVVKYMIGLKGNEYVRSVNAIVGETNDGWLNDIRGHHVKEEDVWDAIQKAGTGPVEEGSVGAGTGTTCLGFKGGIGTSSRKLPQDLGGWTVGVLVQTNFGGILSINGAPVGRELNRYYLEGRIPDQEDGSCMVIVATDAPLLHRNLKRLAFRAMLGLARCGNFCMNGSGDYVIAFSTHPDCRIRSGDRGLLSVIELRNEQLNPLFLAVVESTEEAVYNSLFQAVTIKGRNGHLSKSLPLDRVLDICKKYNVLNWYKLLPVNRIK